MGFLLQYPWEIFITIEIIAFLSLLFFGIFRYFFERKHLSLSFIVLFLILLFAEGALGLYVYQETGEISTFQIVILVFLLYACTFGIFDFIRLDRWLRKHIGRFRKVELLTEKDYKIMNRNKDPKYLAKKYRMTSTIHLFIFIIGQAVLWSMGVEDIQEAKDYLLDLSWFDQGHAENTPYANDTLYGIGVLWGIVFLADFIYSWSYTFFPSSTSKD